VYGIINLALPVHRYPAHPLLWWFFKLPLAFAFDIRGGLASISFGEVADAWCL